MRHSAVALLIGWIALIVPGWIGAMLWSNEIVLLPASDMGWFEWIAFFFAMYGLPAIALLLWLGASRKSPNSNA